MRLPKCENQNLSLSNIVRLKPMHEERAPTVAERSSWLGIKAFDRIRSEGGFSAKHERPFSALIYNSWIAEIIEIIISTNLKHHPITGRI